MFVIKIINLASSLCPSSSIHPVPFSVAGEGLSSDILCHCHKKKKDEIKLLLTNMINSGLYMESKFSSDYSCTTHCIFLLDVHVCL